MITSLSNFKKRDYLCPTCGIAVVELSCAVDSIGIHSSKYFPEIEDLKKENRSLFLDVATSRDTNRRLNRRCQELEALVKYQQKKLQALDVIRNALKENT